MNQRPRRDTLLDLLSFAATLLVVALVVMAVLGVTLKPHVAKGGEYAKRVAYDSAVVIADQYAPYYRIAAELGDVARREWAFRQSPSYERLIYLEGYLAGQAAGAGPPAEAVEAPPAEPQPTTWAERYKVTFAKCASCHGQQNPSEPAGDLYLNGDKDLEEDAAAWRDVLRAVWNGRMPKNHPPLEGEVLYDFLDEHLKDPPKKE